MKVSHDAREGIVRIDGISVPYHDTGGPEDPRTIVALIHGTGGNTALHFRSLFPMLSTHFRVVSIDLQPVPAELTMDSLAAQVAGVLQDRCPERPAHLLGFSLGALVAATVASKRAELVSTLTLVAGWVKADNHQKLRNRLWHHLYVNDREALKQFATWTAHGHAYLSSKSEAEIATLIDTRTFSDSVEAHMLLNRRADISDELNRVNCPVLVVAGRHDVMVPNWQSQLLYGGLKNARYALVDAGHALPIERPAELFQLTTDFITKPEAVSAGEMLATTTI